MSDEADRAALTIAGLGLLGGSTGVVVRQLALPATTIVWARLLCAIGPLAWWVLRQNGQHLRRPSRSLLVNGALVAAHWTCLVAAYQRAPIGTVLLITYLSPIGITALAPRVLGETVHRHIVTALALSVLGVAFIALPSARGGARLGVALAVITGMLYVALALTNKKLTSNHSGSELALWQMLIAAALLTPAAATAQWPTPNRTWLWLPVLGIVYTALFFTAYLNALGKVDASRAIVLLYLEPASAIGFGWIFLHEHPTLATLTGGALIVTAGYLALRNRRTDDVSDVQIRAAGVEDFTFLATMLGEAAVWCPDKPAPTADEVMADPRYSMYLVGWPRHGDYGIVAKQHGPVGAAWFRTYTEESHGYGFVGEDVPELSIAVVASRRHEGIGRRLLADLIEASVARGYRALSLSVAEDNPACALYESFGFVPVEKHGHTWTMVRHGAQPN